jgi:hypothetical protein
MDHCLIILEAGQLNLLKPNEKLIFRYLQINLNPIYPIIALSQRFRPSKTRGGEKTTRIS